MAISRQGSGNGGKLTGGPSSMSWAFSTPSSLVNSCLVLDIWSNLTTLTASSVQYNGVAATAVGNSGSTSDGICYRYYWLNPASGSHNVTANFAGTRDEIYPAVIIYDDVDQTTPFGASVVQQANSTTMTAVLARIYANSWAVGTECGQRNSQSGTNFTIVQQCFSQHTMSDSNASLGAAGNTNIVANQNLSSTMSMYVSELVPTQPAAAAPRGPGGGAAFSAGGLMFHHMRRTGKHGILVPERFARPRFTPIQLSVKRKGDLIRTRSGILVA